MKSLVKTSVINPLTPDNKQVSEQIGTALAKHIHESFLRLGKNNMENGLYIGLSRQIALQKRMDLVANNIANVNTPGYRADKILFEEYVYNTRTDSQNNEKISMVLDYGQYKDTSAGQTTFTGNPLDVALNGQGFMMVDSNGTTKYTRAGNFTTDSEGTLVTASGKPVLDSGGGQITIPKGAKDITITQDGQIVTDQGTAGKIGMVEFENPQMLIPTGDGLYEPVDDTVVSAEAENTTMKQGMIEGSNVQAVLEMTDLIEISRQYQSNQRLLQNEHDRQSDTIEKLSQV